LFASVAAGAANVVMYAFSEERTVVWFLRSIFMFDFGFAIYYKLLLLPGVLPERGKFDAFIFSLFSLSDCSIAQESSVFN